MLLVLLLLLLPLEFVARVLGLKLQCKLLFQLCLLLKRFLLKLTQAGVVASGLLLK